MISIMRNSEKRKNQLIFFHICSMLKPMKIFSPEEYKLRCL